MLIRHIGHAEFYLETESGVRIVIRMTPAAVFR